MKDLKLRMIVCLFCMNAIGEVSATVLDAQLQQIMDLLPGRYSSTEPKLQHKIMRIDAPKFGRQVFFHQIFKDGLDSKSPLQQKIYVFNTFSGRTENSMRSFVLRPGQKAPGISLLKPDELMSFPKSCAIVWTQGKISKTFLARVKHSKCQYRSAFFKQKISPELTYILSKESFSLEDVLYGETGAPLFSSTGLINAARVEESTPAGTMAAVIAASVPTDWRDLDPTQTLYMELDTGRVIFELAPTFAPKHVENIRLLIMERWFDGLSINRVQDNFVVQWGDASEAKKIINASPSLVGEFEREWSKELVFTQLADGDVYADQVGFVEGMPVAGDLKNKKLWLAHCYATLGVGRNTSSDSGSGAELYVVIGQPPRQLDRNITVIGRAVLGMELLSALPRGQNTMGFYDTPSKRILIRSLRFASDVPTAQRTALQVMRTDTESFLALIESRRNRRDEFYKVPAGHIDLCSVPLPVRNNFSNF